VICDAFQVAIVPFPFVDKPAIKRRPALALSNRVFNAGNGHTLFAMITTGLIDTWPDDHALIAPEEAGLVQNCYVRWKIFTLPNTLILRTLGTVGVADKAALTAKLTKILPVSIGTPTNQ